VENADHSKDPPFLWHKLREGLEKHKVNYEKEAGRTFPKYNLRGYWGGSTQILDFEDKLLGLKK
jgi:hypothetical protein